LSEGLLSIGAFSRATGISVNTLRSYHDTGVLVPARIDRQSGYRSYTADQLTDALIVVRLRTLDVPLAQVREIIEAHDPDTTRRILEAHQRTMHERLSETERIISELQHGFAPETNTPVHVRHHDAQHIARVTGDIGYDDLWHWLQRSYVRIGDAAAAGGGLLTGGASALYEAQIDNEEFERVEAFLPIAAPFVIPKSFGDVTIGEVPEGFSAVLVHRGPFANIGETYVALGAWVAHHAEPTGAKVCERYLVGPGNSADEAAYRTEISWPIVRI